MNICSLNYFIFAIILITNHFGSSKSECVESQAGCVCILADGQGYNLTLMEHETPLVNENFNFTFSPCKNADLTFSKSKANETDCKSTSLCVLNGTKSINLGSVEESQWQVSSKNNVAQLIYAHKNYMTKITLNCCQDCTASKLSVDASTVHPNYNVHLFSKKSCLVTMRGKPLSTGSVLVILFTLFTGLYFIGGAVALKLLRGAVGWELIPNYDFWSDLPALVRDGVTFTLSGCSVVSYERI